MFSPQLLIAVARERHADLLRGAGADRDARLRVPGSRPPPSARARVRPCGPRPKKGGLTVERLARLVERRARSVVSVAAVFFAVSAALGAGVASRLDPFGVDDSATESVIADQRLEDAGFREPLVVVLAN